MHKQLSIIVQMQIVVEDWAATWGLGEIELKSLTRQDPDGEETDLVTRLQESKVTIDEEDVEAREHGVGVWDADVEYEENYEHNVEVMCVEEELKWLPPYLWEATYPHY